MRPFSFSYVLVFGAAVGTAQLAAPARALAQTSATDTARVTQLFKSGKAAFAKNDMPEAERLFAEAFALRKSSDIAANLGQSELEQQKYRAAAEHFQWALVNLLPSANDNQRRAVENGLARSRAEVAVLRLEIEPDGSDVLVGEQHVGKSPIGASVYVDPGEVIIAVNHEGFVSIDKRVIAGKGTEQAVEITLAPKDTPAPGAAVPVVSSGTEQNTGPSSLRSAADRPAHKSLVPAFVATGIAVAGGAVGLGFTLHAGSKEDDADKLRDQLNALGGCDKDGTAPTSDCADLADRRKSVDSARNIGLGAFIVGGVAALTAGYLYWDALSSSRSRSRSASARAPSKPRFVALTPTIDVGRAHDQRTLGTLKLSLSGTF